MTATRYLTLSRYNAWANRRIYRAAAQLSPLQFREDRGTFFRSVHGTLNHLLVTDRIWMKRFTGMGEIAAHLDAILFEDLDALERARLDEDARIITFATALDEPALAADIRYANSSGASFTQPLDTALDHFFNHQTHHRGQTHALLSHFLGNVGAPSLDLVAFQRESGLATPL
ncbi:damage-inducible protein DinB [Ancylobacter sp. Lp-2]|uniref:DinB family protein n=1 Tax=Ancylobacter sp. Lp-2 TaxID=2881339 RepID=UPI001E537426|nr:DinB family protein [Ancylobacter sp. Lp-2]MCB4769245.1 damage-inducible protein DinB [Ancylobacter sp. Lp-2]